VDEVLSSLERRRFILSVKNFKKLFAISVEFV